MKCFFCKTRTSNGIIRCDHCMGRAASPLVITKGLGWTGAKPKPTYNDVVKEGAIGSATPK